MFGSFHFAAVIACVIGAYLYCRSAAGREETVLFRTGVVLLVMEVMKQVFIFSVLNQGRYYNWWYVPFQLCSVPMYLCLCLPGMSGKPPPHPPHHQDPRGTG